MIGALINNFMPPIVADSLIILLLIAFSAKFYFKMKNLQKQAQEEQKATL